jgi:hypothetical protein
MPLIFAKLVNASHTLPWPNQPGRAFNPEGEMIDPDDPYFGLALRDGSLVEAEPPVADSITTEPPAPDATRAPSAD